MRILKFILLFLFLLFVKLGDFVSSTVTTVFSEIASLLKRALRHQGLQRVPRLRIKTTYFRVRKKQTRVKNQRKNPNDANKIKYFLIGTLTSLVFLFIPLLVF